MSKEKETLEEKIEVIIEKHKFEEQIKEELKKDIKNLIHKVRFPENYCLECGEQMFWEKNSFVCLNCGYKPKTEPVIFEQKEKIQTKTPRKNTSILEALNKIEGGNIQTNPNEPAPLGATSKDVNWV